MQKTLGAGVKGCVQEEALNWADSTEKWRQEVPGRGSKLIKHRTMRGDGWGRTQGVRGAGGGGGDRDGNTKLESWRKVPQS